MEKLETLSNAIKWLKENKPEMVDRCKEEGIWVYFTPKYLKLPNQPFTSNKLVSWPPNEIIYHKGTPWRWELFFTEGAMAIMSQENTYAYWLSAVYKKVSFWERIKLFFS